MRPLRGRYAKLAHGAQVTRIHAAVCAICGEPIRKAREQVGPAVYPYQLPGFHRTDRAHKDCASRLWSEHNARVRAGAIARAEGSLTE